MIGVSAIAISFMIMAIFIAVFEFTDDGQIILILSISFILLLTGVYYIFRSIRLFSLIKWFIKNVRQVFSPSGWNNMAYAISHFSISVSYDRRNRFERLQDEIIDHATSSRDPVQTLYEALRNLGQEDYLIVSVKDKPSHFIQYIKLAGYVRLELPVTKIKTNQQKLD
jgi:uncharacterized membrane protein